MNYRRITKIAAGVAAAGLVFSTQSVRAGNQGNEAAQQQQSAASQVSSQPSIALTQAGVPIDEAAGAQAVDPTGFMQAARQGNKSEIEEGQLAQEKGQSRQVKRLAEHLIRDHQAMGEKLKALAQEKNIQLSPQLDAKHQQKVDALAALSGAAFDRQFLNEQVKCHEKTIALFQRAASSNADPDVKSFAQSNLPTLEHHLQMAQKDSAAINEPSGAGKNGTAGQ